MQKISVLGRCRHWRGTGMVKLRCVEPTFSLKHDETDGTGIIGRLEFFSFISRNDIFDNNNDDRLTAFDPGQPG